MLPFAPPMKNTARYRTTKTRPSTPSCRPGCICPCGGRATALGLPALRPPPWRHSIHCQWPISGRTNRPGGALRRGPVREKESVLFLGVGRGVVGDRRLVRDLGLLDLGGGLLRILPGQGASDGLASERHLNTGSDLQSSHVGVDRDDRAVQSANGDDLI